MRSAAMFVSSAGFLGLGLTFGHFAVVQGDLGYAVGASVSGLLGLGSIGAALTGR